MAIPREYLGDGVYADHEGFAIRVWTERKTGTHEIFIEPEAMINLLKLARQFWPHFESQLK